jgi:hypothetical protein
MVLDTAETVASSKIVIITDAVTKNVKQFSAIVHATNDTITLSDLTVINGAALMKRADGTACTCTVATNVITVTQAGMSDTPVEGLAIGT